MKKAIKVSAKGVIRFAALLSVLSTDQIKQLCRRNKAPNSYRDLALLVVKYRDNFLLAKTADAEQLLTTLEKLDAFRRPERFYDYLQVENIVAKSGGNKSHDRLVHAFKVARRVSAQDLITQGLTGGQINSALHKKRRMAIDRIDDMSGFNPKSGVFCRIKI